ncbi:hypothetical protein SARC_10491, partial [Sphaeroforma arctica JP610]
KEPDTTASDVYMLGILMWEVYTLGGPTLVQRLRFEKENAMYLERPMECMSGELYDIAVACWNPNADERPLLPALVTKLESIFDRHEEMPSGRNSILAVLLFTTLYKHTIRMNTSTQQALSWLYSTSFHYTVTPSMKTQGYYDVCGTKGASAPGSGCDMAQLVPKMSMPVDVQHGHPSYSGIS